jgi:taurine dehydrogenase small subunit
VLPYTAALPSTLPNTGQETMASMALQHRVADMSVVEEAGRPIDGARLAWRANVMRREHVEARPSSYHATSPGSEHVVECAIMKTEVSEVTVAVLQAFADAWNEHDVDALMSFMTEDCVFESSAGEDVCGSRYVGKDAVRAGFAEVWSIYPDAHWGDARHFVHGDRGVSEWTFTGTRLDGTRVEVHGCDLFTLRDGKILLKNSYRKNRPPVAQR